MARPRQFDEKKVLHAVRDQFWTAGYGATSLEDLMRVSGLGKGSLYAAFGDKHGLFLQSLRSYVDTTVEYLRSELDSTRAIEALRAFMMAPTSDQAAARRGCFMANSTYELAVADPEVIAEASRMYDATTDALAQTVARAQSEGDIDPTTDATQTARAILTAQQGITYMGRTGMPIERLRDTASVLTDQLLPIRKP